MIRRIAIVVAWALLAVSASGMAQEPLASAQKQYQAGQYAAAIKTLEAALQQNAQDARLHFWLGRCHYELRDFDKAIISFERAVALDAKNSDYHLWLGKAYGRKANLERSFSLARKTKREFEEAVRLDGKNIPARRALLEYLAEAPWIAGGSDGKAWEQAEAVAALDPVEGHLARADYWMSNENPDRADAEYRKMLELKPARVDAYFEAVRFYVNRGDLAQAQAVNEAAARLDAADPRPNFYRGVLRVRAGKQLNEAEKLLRSYLAAAPQREGFPSHVAANEWLGRLYEQQGKRDEAIAAYRAALQMDPRRKSTREALERLEKKS